MANDGLLSSPWDTCFKVSMSHPETALAVIERNTDPQIWQLCDTSTFTSRPGNFIDSVTRQEYRADLVCQMNTRSGDGMVVFLVEHQSSVDADMDLRMFHYGANLMYATYMTSRVVPLLLPVVIYHGSVRLNKTRSSWLDLVRPKALRRFIRAGVLEPVVYDDLGSYSHEQILTHGRPAMMETILNYGREPLERFLPKLVSVMGSSSYSYSRQEQFDAVRFIGARYNIEIQALLSHVNSQQYTEFKEVLMDFVATIENAAVLKGIDIGIAKGIAKGKAEGIAEGKVKGIAEGKAKGIAEGEAKGKAENKAETARRMLNDGFDDIAVMKYACLSKEELDSLRNN